MSVRSLGSALATGTNWGCNFLVGLTVSYSEMCIYKETIPENYQKLKCEQFLPMMGFLTPAITFSLYAMICLVGWVGTWSIYPETKGLGLEDVQLLLKTGWGVTESLEKQRSRNL